MCVCVCEGVCVWGGGEVLVGSGGEEQKEAKPFCLSIDELVDEVACGI